MDVRAKVAMEKERHPERFCKARRCLWRVLVCDPATREMVPAPGCRDGRCPRHAPAEAPEAKLKMDSRCNCEAEFCHPMADCGERPHVLAEFFGIKVTLCKRCLDRWNGELAAEGGALKVYDVTVVRGTTTHRVPVRARSQDEALDQALLSLGLTYRTADKASAQERPPLEPFVERFAAALRDHEKKGCPACEAFERDREERGVNS